MPITRLTYFVYYACHTLLGLLKHGIPFLKDKTTVHFEPSTVLNFNTVLWVIHQQHNINFMLYSSIYTLKLTSLTSKFPAQYMINVLTNDRYKRRTYLPVCCWLGNPTYRPLKIMCLHALILWYSYVYGYSSRWWLWHQNSVNAKVSLG